MSFKYSVKSDILAVSNKKALILAAGLHPHPVRGRSPKPGSIGERKWDGRWELGRGKGLPLQHDRLDPPT